MAATQDETFYYLSSSLPRKECSFKPILKTQRLTLTILDPRSEEDTAFGLHCVASGSQFKVDTAEKWHAFRDATKLRPCHTPYKQAVSGPCVYCVRLGTDSDDGERVGLIFLDSRDEDMPPDIGWFTLPQHTRSGYASEAAACVLEYFRSEFQGGFRNATPPLDIVALLSEANVASVGSARKIGFSKWGDISMVVPGEETVVVAIYGFASELPPGNVYTADRSFHRFGAGEAGMEVARMLGMIS